MSFSEWYWHKKNSEFSKLDSGPQCKLLGPQVIVIAIKVYLIFYLFIYLFIYLPMSFLLVRRMLYHWFIRDS